MVMDAHFFGYHSCGMRVYGIYFDYEWIAFRELLSMKDTQRHAFAF